MSDPPTISKPSPEASLSIVTEKSIDWLLPFEKQEYVCAKARKNEAWDKIVTIIIIIVKYNKYANLSLFFVLDTERVRAKPFSTKSFLFLFVYLLPAWSIILIFPYRDANIERPFSYSGFSKYPATFVFSWRDHVIVSVGKKKNKNNSMCMYIMQSVHRKK